MMKDDDDGDRLTPDKLGKRLLNETNGGGGRGVGGANATNRAVSAAVAAAVAPVIAPLTGALQHLQPAANMRNGSVSGTLKCLPSSSFVGGTVYTITTKNHQPNKENANRSPVHGWPPKWPPIVVTNMLSLEEGESVQAVVNGTADYAEKGFLYCLTGFDQKLRQGFVRDKQPEVLQVVEFEIDQDDLDL